MKKIILLMIFLGCLYLFSGEILGCTVVETEVKLSEKEVKKYYLEQFKGAIFAGKVLNVKKVTVKWFGADELMNEVNLEVEKYWFGVKQPNMTIYTGTGGGDCSLDFEPDKSYFLVINENGGLLWANFTNSSKIDLKEDIIEEMKYFDGIFGEGKTFQKNN